MYPSLAECITIQTNKLDLYILSFKEFKYWLRQYLGTAKDEALICHASSVVKL